MKQDIQGKASPIFDEGEKTATKKKSSKMGIPLSAFIEGILFFSCAIAIDVAFFNGERYWNISPHPYWLIVLLFSFQYGTSAALTISIVSSTVLLWENIPEQRISQDYYEYIYSIFALPLSWGMAALLFGELRRRQLMENATLHHELSQAGNREETLAQAYRKMSALNERLEARIASQRQTVFTLFKAGRAVERLETRDVLGGVEQLVREVLAPSKFSLYILQNTAFELVFNVGWQEDELFLRQIGNETALFRVMVDERRIVCIANSADEQIMAGQGVLAGPIVHAETQDVLGLIKIEEIGFLDLHPETIENFRILCDWVGAAYAKAQKYENSLLPTTDRGERHLMPANTLEPLTIWLANLASRAEFGLWMLAITIPYPIEKQEKWDESSAGEILLRHFRSTDLIFHPSEGSQKIFVLLPATHAAGVQTVVDKITEAFRWEYLMIEGHASIDIQVTRISEVYESI